MLSTQVGILLMSSGAGLLAFQWFIYHRLVNRFGLRQTFIGGAALFAIVALCLPFVHLTLDQPAEGAAVSHPWTMWAAAVLGMLGKVWTLAAAFTSVMVLINNAALGSPGISLSIANGVSQTVASGVRCVGPALGGLLWSIMVRLRDLPFHTTVVFGVASVFAGLGAWIVRMLPNWVEEPPADIASSASTVELANIPATSDELCSDAQVHHRHPLGPEEGLAAVI